MNTRQRFEIEIEKIQSKPRHKMLGVFSLSLSQAIRQQWSAFSSQLGVAQQGFGLLEVLISAGILALISGATVALATNAVRTGILSGDRTVAFQLSQEGIDLVRQMRDTTYIDGKANHWNDIFPTACQTGCFLAEDRTSLTGPTWSLQPNPVGGNIAMGAGALDSTGKLPQTSFIRVIKIEPISWYTKDATDVPNNNSTAGSTIPPTYATPADQATTLALKVTSTVTWQEQGRSISVDSSTFLTDWRPVQ